VNEPSAYRFEKRETLSLVASTLVLAAAFSFLLSCSYLIETALVANCAPGFDWGMFFGTAFPVSLVLVLGAFVLHELAHKFAAQYYGLWAEFRASTWGLLLALAASGTFGIVVASPGAVVIMGPADDREAGIISVLGPIVNIALAVIALPLWLATDQPAAFDVGLPRIGNVFQLALLVNVVLAAFNMLPIKPLDGSKVVRWSISAFVVVWLAIAALFARTVGFI
jgi:Zn-dependent protease